MGELSLIEKFRAGAPTHPWITVGPGSDCAALSWPASDELLFKIDQVIEGTHFVLDGPGSIALFCVGWKAMAKTCSDIAAAGGWPVAAMVAINVKKGSKETLVLDVYEGIVECCKRYDIGLAGGDFSSSENGLSVTVSLVGNCPKGRAWTRGGARPGDVLLLTGGLGGSLTSSKHFDFDPQLVKSRWVRESCPDGVHACIDITDGLARDIVHICKESQCGARIVESKVPISSHAKSISKTAAEAFNHALSDGEDFELLFAVEPEQASRLLKTYYPDYDGIDPLIQIGEIMPLSNGITVVGEDGTEHPLPDIGYEHVV